MAAGFDGFQGKPISVRELLETIRKYLPVPADMIGQRFECPTIPAWTVAASC
jgi:hypothetical protein